jgi:hypothetical protein
MSQRDASDPLLPILERVEGELDRKLEEVCEIKPVSEEPTGEFIRLEEKLLEAAQAAKQAFSIRRRMRQRNEGGSAERAVNLGHLGTADAAELAGDAPGSAVRALRDNEGNEWQVWAVKPGALRPAVGTEHLGEYGEGWLAFEAADGTQRRRLPHPPKEWQALPDEELMSLLSRAETVRPISRD